MHLGLNFRGSYILSLFPHLSLESKEHTLVQNTNRTLNTVSSHSSHSNSIVCGFFSVMSPTAIYFSDVGPSPGHSLYTAATPLHSLYSSVWNCRSLVCLTSLTSSRHTARGFVPPSLSSPEHSLGRLTVAWKGRVCAAVLLSASHTTRLLMSVSETCCI